MACILHIETSGEVCSVALSDGGEVVFAQEDRQGFAHSERCAPFADDALKLAEVYGRALDAVAVSLGPGSYTGLRIGFTLAKAIAYARRVPLLALPTLEVMCVPLLLYHEEEAGEGTLLAPMIDARRMEVYTAVYDRSLRCIEPAEAMVVGQGSFEELLSRRQVCFFGGGAGKCRELLSHPNAFFVEGIEPLAQHMPPLAERALARGEQADVAYSEPFYLKDFMAGKPRKLI